MATRSSQESFKRKLRCACDILKQLASAGLISQKSLRFLFPLMFLCSGAFAILSDGLS